MNTLLLFLLCTNFEMSSDRGADSNKYCYIDETNYSKHEYYSENENGNLILNNQWSIFKEGSNSIYEMKYYYKDDYRKLVRDENGLQIEYFQISYDKVRKEITSRIDEFTILTTYFEADYNGINPTTLNRIAWLL